MNAYLACFDISDDRIRTRIGRELEHYGMRVQRSVFEISLADPAELTALCARLRDWLEPGDDLRFYCLCAACRKKSHDHQGRRVAYFPAAVVI